MLAAAEQEIPFLFLCAASGTCRTVLADLLVSPAKPCMFPFSCLGFLWDWGCRLSPCTSGLVEVLEQLPLSSPGSCETSLFVRCRSIQNCCHIDVISLDLLLEKKALPSADHGSGAGELEQLPHC